MPRIHDNNLLSPSELKYLLIDSLTAYTEDATYLSGNNPYKFEVNGKTLFIAIKNIHDSGEGRTNPDECRIQIGRSDNYAEVISLGLPLFLFGYNVRNNTFTVWDPSIQTLRINQRTTISLYSKFSKQAQAALEGIAVYIDNNSQRVISFKPEYLGLYLENFTFMHLSDEKALLSLVNFADETGETEAVGSEVIIGGQEFVVTHRKLKRDQNFRKLVNQAYSFRCVFCGIQLEIVEAAHIVPHAHPEGNDEPNNGICLCVLHHAAYDSGLIYFTIDGSIKINRNRINYLTKVSRDGGMVKFTDMHYTNIATPSSTIYNPLSENIIKANRLRGIDDE